MSKKSIEERLEDYCEYAEATKRFADAGFYREVMAEIESLRQQAEGNEEQRLNEQTIVDMGEKLTQIVNITKGEPEECTMHSTHDAVESVQKLADRVRFVESALASLSSHIRKAMVRGGLRAEDESIPEPPLNLLGELSERCRAAGEGNFDQQYFELLKVLDEVGRPWMREDGEGGMKGVIQRMAQTAKLNGTASDLDNVKHLARFLAKQWSQLEDLRRELRQMATPAIKEAVVMRWPIVQGMENQKKLREIAEQTIMGDKVAAGVKVMLADPAEDACSPPRADLQPEVVGRLRNVIDVILESCEPKDGASDHYAGFQALKDLENLKALIGPGEQKKD